MKNYYEATYILDIEGKEDGVDNMIAVLKAQIEKLNGRVVKTQKMDQRRFERVAGKIHSGFYLCLGFELESTSLKQLEESFKHDARVYRQFYLKPKKAPQPAAA